MNAHRGTPGTVRLARILLGAICLWATERTGVDHDARTGGAYFKVTFGGHRYTIRVTEVDE